MDLMLISVSFILSCFVIIFSQKYFLNNSYVDKVNNRSSHSSRATRSGGLSIFLTLFLISVYFYVKGYEIYEFSLLIPFSLLVLIGLYDDINGVNFKLKFIFQVIAAKIIIDNGLIIDNLHGFLGVYDLSRVVAQLFTIFIIVAIINSINFIDGIDGLAISVVLFFIVMFEFFAIKQTPYLNFSIILFCSIIPLYYFNFRKKDKIFLGDSGSLFLGGVISIYVVFILSQEYIIKKEFDLNKILFVISIMSYPIVDIIRVVFLRIINGKSPFEADKNHIHHILLKKIQSHFITTISIITFTIIVLLLLQLLNLL